MKKKLLFSLLLGSAFSWTNEIHATEVTAITTAESSVNETASKDAAIRERPEKKHKAIGLDGKEIEVQFFDKAMHPDLVTKELTFQDGGTYDPTGKKNFPYMAGEKMPEGAAVVYVLRKNSNPDELKLVPADADISKFPGYSGSISTEWWMYKDENNYLYPYVEKEDPNAQFILGKKASVYIYEVPDLAATEKEKELADIREQLKSGGGIVATSEQATRGENPVIITSDAPFWEKFQFGDGLFDGKRIDFVITTSDPKATPETFAKLKRDLLETFSEKPNVATAMFALALEDLSNLKEGKPESLKNVRITYEGISATLMFSSEVDPLTARAYINDLMTKHTMSHEDIRNLQKEHEQKLAEYERTLADLEEKELKLEEERLKNKQMQEELAIAAQKAAAAQEVIEEITLEKVAATEVAAQALNAADEHRVEQVQTVQALDETREKLTVVQAEQNQIVQALDETQEKLTVAQAEQNQTVQALDETQEKLTVAQAEQDKTVRALDEAREKLTVVQAEQNQTVQALDETQEKLTVAQIDEATLKAQKEAAEEAAQRAEAEKMVAEDKLAKSHAALIEATINSGDTAVNTTAPISAQKEQLASPVHSEESPKDSVVQGEGEGATIQHQDVNESTVADIHNDENLSLNPQLPIKKDKMALDPELLKGSEPSILQQSLAPYLSQQSLAAEAG